MGWIWMLLGPLLLVIGYAVGRGSRRHLRDETEEASQSAEWPARPTVEATTVTPMPASLPAPPPPDPKQAIYAVAQGAHEDYQRAAQPAHMIGASGFEDCVEAMRASPLSNLDLLGFYTGESVVFAVCAAEALARRPPDPVIRQRLLRSLNDFHPYTRFFGLRAITAATPATESVVALVIPMLDDSWDNPPFRTILTDFVAERLAAGDAPRLEALRAEPSDDTCALLDSVLQPLDQPEVTAFLESLARLRAGRIDVEFLRSIGTVGPSTDGIIVEHRALVVARDAVTAAVTSTPPRPVLLVGSPGSGRTTLMQAVWRELRGRGWNLFRAGHAELIADQSYVGQIESRVKRLLAELGRSRRVLWVAPAFQAFIFSGRFRGNPTGLLDLVLPGVLDGHLPFVGITEPTGLDLLIRNKPEILTSFEIVRLDPVPEDETLAIARVWDRERPGPPAPFGEPLLREASHLAQQYLGDMATPGSLIKLLKMVCHDLAADAAGDAVGAGVTATLDDLIACVGRMTRLPASILDERQMLDLGSLSAFFTARVIGQPEAVETLVERVAMIKAGVTDPTRPLGVFLFAGPTGTGKTEIAKALAEYLCGSPARLVRVDMSELQGPESLGRLLGEGTRDVAGNALVDAVRRNPFSVILLDEFEKSHPQVWDLFLQVFDDGRLTDLRGFTADFRNCVIILTSNLGSTLPTGPGLGFGGTSRPPAESVEKAIERAFRREFFNRIDRVVVFRPLSRDVLREILHKELRDVFERRGLRNRGWVVVWDETAIDFLLERGTTPDLGARPLKRAIERHVLAPLARTIVEHEYPQGDQFLFVRRIGDRLEAEFVDPDAQPAAPAAGAAGDRAELVGTATQPSQLEALAFDPRGGDDEIPCLERHLADLVAAIDDDEWRERKRTTLERQQEPGFWDSPQRFAVFGLIEQMDRIEAGVRSAASLFEKLRGAPSSGRTRFAAEHAGRLALRLFVLEIAVADVREGRPLDAFVSIEAADAGEPQRAAMAAFIARLAAMYGNWADRRGLKVEVLVDDAGGRGTETLAAAAAGGAANTAAGTAAVTTASRPPRIVMAVSGLAAHTLLLPESGLHLFEEPAAVGSGFDRVQVRVRVAPQPEVPPADGSVGLRAQALSAVEAVPAAAQVVRRYRERPSPLVRDTVRGWRSGRIDRVYAGDFDLLVAAEPADDARP